MTLQELLINNFATSGIQKRFEALSTENRAVLLSYLSKGTLEGIKLPVSSSMKTDFGIVSLKQRNNFRIDKKLLEHYIMKNEISLNTVLNVASFSENLKLVIGDELFSLLSTNIPTTYIELRSNDAVKEIFEEKCLVFEVTMRNILKVF